MTEREKLIEILGGMPGIAWSPSARGVVADYLLANGVAVQKWIPIPERLPTFDDLPDYAGSDYHLVCCESPITGKRTVQPAIASYDGFANKYLTSCYGATHWMPLPEPPKEEP